MAQAKGSSAKLLAYKEATYGVTPGTPHALVMPINTSGIKASRNLTTAKTIRGRRDAAAPSQGNTDAGGPLEVPVDLRAFGWWLQGAIGIPTTTQVAATQINNAGVAVNVGSGVSGIPVTAHGFQPGESVTIAGTVSYNGTYTVLPSSTANQVNITKAFQAETFGPDDTIRPARYSHVFKVDESLYSYVMEQQYPDIGVYQLFNGCKTNKLDMKIGGDGELVATIDIMAAKETIGVAAFDAAPTTVNVVRFSNFQAAIKENGVNCAIIKEMSLSLSNGLDGDTFCIGGGGVRGALNEGICAVSGSISAIFQDAVLYNKAVNGTESGLEVIFTNGVWSLSLNIPELIFKRQSPGITTPGGIWLEAPFEGYFDDAAGDSVIVATLVNDVSNYVWA